MEEDSGMFLPRVLIQDAYPFSMLPETIYFARHGQSIGNARGLDDASLKDLANHRFPLTKKGKEESRVLGAFIRENVQYDVLYTSTFLRPQETLHYALGSVEHKMDALLDEWWKGIFHSMSAEEREQFYPAEQAIVEREGWYHYRPPQGESGKDVERRLRQFLAILDGTPLIFGHGRVAGFLDRMLCNREIDLNCKYEIPKNCELWRFQKEKQHYVRTSLFTSS